MLSRLISKLTYSNVVATVALFLALGGGIAWALTNDSVRSKHIKDGQVKPQDLSDASKPQALTYSAATGDNVQQEILNNEGYRVLAACDSVSGRPELEFFLEFPEDGRLTGFTVHDPSNDAAVPASGSGLDGIDGGAVFSGGALEAPASERDIIYTTLIYEGITEGAALNLHLVADDDDDQCRLSGLLTTGVIPPA